MSRVLDLFYAVVLLLLAPWLMLRSLRTGRYRRGWRQKLLGRHEGLPQQAIWFHGVSVGEIHLLRPVLTGFRRRHPDQPCVISTTTDTGYAAAQRLYPDLPVFYFPLDFSWSVRRTLHTLRPRLVVLAESEIWPNFLREARRQGIPLALINARMSPRSLARFRRLAWLAGWMFRSFDLIVAQTREYMAAYLSLGAVPGRVQVSGSVKYDGALTDPENPKTVALRERLSLSERETVWVAGSTQAPEEEVCLAVFQKARALHPELKLILVPRSPDRFDEVARLIERSGSSFVRWSAVPPGTALPAGMPVVLIDTIGELGALWGLADLAFVGGSLDGKRGGQNMIEPAAFGTAVLFGPWVWNFAEPAARLVALGGAIQVSDATELECTVLRLLADAEERQAMGQAARRFVLQQQGATERTLDLLDRLLPPDGSEQPRAA
jgi:3-deoxy-D-manno-octulosonic-acid transferase